MTRWDKNEIDLKDTEQFYQKNNVKDWVKKGNIKNIYSMNENSFRNLKEAEIFNMLNHIECYNDIYKNKYKNCLILEDDCIILNDNFEEKINYILSSNIKDTYDFVFMGNYCIKNIKKFNKINDVLYSTQQSNTADSYLVSLKAIKKLLSDKDLFPFVYPIDFEMNYWFQKNDMNVYWHYPELIKQGSGNKYISSVV